MTNRPPNTATPGWPLMERSIVATVLGLPGYAAIGIALAFTGLGVFIDLERISGLGTIFKGCYFAGCVLAVCWVKRRALFGSMVQPPLLLAVAVPGVVLAAGGGSGSSGAGTAARALAIGTPLLNGFPTMAVTTAFVLAIGIGRYLVQKPVLEPERPPASARRSSELPAEDHPFSDSPQPPEPATLAERVAERERSAKNRAAVRDRPAERHPPGLDPSEEPTSVMPLATEDGTPPSSGRPGEPGRPAGQRDATGPREPGGPGRPPRKSDLHAARKRPPATRP